MKITGIYTDQKMTSEITSDVVDYVEIWFDRYKNHWVIMANNKAGYDVGETQYSPYKTGAIDIALREIAYYKWDADVLVSNRDSTDCKIISRNSLTV